MSPSDITPATALERAIGVEVLTEAARIPLSHKEIQDASGIGDRSFRRYFVKSERHIPMDELEKVAEVLGLPLSELLRRAQENLPHLKAAQTRRSATKDEDD